MGHSINHTDSHYGGFDLLNITDLNNNSTAFQGPGAPDKIISLLMVVVLFITMVSLGCTMELDKIKGHLRRPKGVAIAIVAQYGIMPLTAFGLGKALQMSPMEAVTVLVCGCCPGGNLSNIMSLALQGDMNLSIVMTACSTLLALGMMPLLLFLYCQGITGLESAVPYAGISIALVMTLVPCAIGVYINHRVPQHAKLIKKVGLGFMLVACTIIGIFASITVGWKLLAVASLRMVTTAALMPLIGYTLGYILSTIFRLNSSCRRTIAMETGCQNIQLCTTILKVAFPPNVIGPLYLFPIVYMFFQAAEAIMFVVIFRCHLRFVASREERGVYTGVGSPTEGAEKSQLPQ